jgi:hypothetical protein
MEENKDISILDYLGINEINERMILIASSIGYVFVVLMLAFITQSPLFSVFVGTLPFLAYISFFLMYFNWKDLSKELVWVFPLFFPLLFLMVAYTGSIKAISQMEYGVVAVLNIVASYLMNALFIFVSTYRKKIDTQKAFQSEYQKLENFYNQKSNRHNNEIAQLRQMVKGYQAALADSKSKLNRLLTTIEDKCKSINFVIGRVYSNKKGGSPAIRKMLKIESSLYNSFSELTKDFKRENVPQLFNVIANIYQKLVQLDTAEKSLFKLEKYKRLNLSRDSQGTDRVIDVLAKNDKDPVAAYILEAKQTCWDIREQLARIQSQ